MQFRNSSASRALPYALAVFLAAAFILISYAYRVYRADLLRETSDRLESVARLKVREIVRWRYDRACDLATEANSIQLGNMAGDLLGGRRPQNAAALSKELAGFTKYDEFSAANLATLDGRVVAEAGDPHKLTREEVREYSARMAKGEDPVFGDLFYCPEHKKVHLRMAAAVRGPGGKPVGLLIARQEPEEYLFPLIQEWPGRSETAETLLVERAGGKVLFLNELRHRKDTAARLLLPLRPDLPATRAVTGEQGFFRGLDYRDREVYSYILPIPGSAWALVAKVDKAEVAAESSYKLLLSVLLWLLLSGAGAYAVYRYLLAHGRAAEELGLRYSAALTDKNETLLLADLATRRIAEVSRACLAMYGYTQDEFLRLRADDLVPPGTEDSLAGRFASVKQGLAVVYEATHRRKDGTLFPVEVTARRLDLGGRAYLHGVLRDITDRRRLEERERLNALRNAALLRLARSGSPDESAFLAEALEEALKLGASRFGYIYLYSEEKRLFTLNCWSKEVMPACAVAEKQSVYELERTGLWGEVVRQRKGLFVNDYAAADPLKKGLPPGHAPLKRWLSVPVFDGDQIAAVAGLANKPEPYTGEDLEQLRVFMGEAWGQLLARRAAARLKEAESRLEKVIANLPGAVFRCSAGEGLKLDFVSDRAGELTGYTAADFVSGRVDFAGLVPEPDRGGLLAAVAAAAGGAAFQHTFRLRRADGAPRWFWAQGVGSAGGGLVDGYFADVTELRESLQERERLTGEVLAKNRELEDFLYVTTHDLRAPLVNIQGYSQDLAAHLEAVKGWIGAAGLKPDAAVAPLLEEEIPVCMNFINSSSAKMDRLISALLRVSRLGRTPPQTERLDMNALADRVIGYFAHRFAEAGAAIKRADLPPCAGDADMVNQVLSNLVDNALKYRDPSRPLAVEIAARPDGAGMVYEVRDNGMGIPPGSLDKVWQMFYRDRGAHAVEGDGIGLPLARRLAERNGGSISVSSVQGEGSVFKLRLPAA